MPSNPLVVITLLFLLSLTAAVILFAFFKSTAVIKTPKYQAGGAIAGFMLVYGVLYPSYQKISDDKNLIVQLQDRTSQLEALEETHKQFEALHDISGTVSPYHDRMQVVLAFTDTEVRADQKFRLSAPCVDVRDRPYTLYVIHDGISYPYVIEHNEDVSALNIPLPK